VWLAISNSSTRSTGDAPQSPQTLQREAAVDEVIARVHLHEPFNDSVYAAGGRSGRLLSPKSMRGAVLARTIPFVVEPARSAPSR